MRASQTQKKGGRTRYLREFDTWTEIAEIAQGILNRSIEGRIRGLPCSSLNNGAGTLWWSGGVTLAQAIRLAREGWPEGKKNLLDTLEQIDIAAMLPQSYLPTPEWDTFGDETDVTRYLQGFPENMVTLVPQVGEHGKLLRIVVEASVSAYVHPKEILNRGAALLSAIHVARLLGYTLECTLLWSITSHPHNWIPAGTNHVTTVNILRAGEVFDLDRFAFWLTHPSVFRRLLFSTMENESPEIRQEMHFFDGGGYGYPVRQPENPPEHDFLLNDGNACPKSPQETIQLTRTILEHCGIILPPSGRPSLLPTSPW